MGVVTADGQGLFWDHMHSDTWEYHLPVPVVGKLVLRSRRGPWPFFTDETPISN